MFPEAKGREWVRLRAMDRCEVCGGTGLALTYSHRLSRGQGGGWEPSNGVRACGSGTTGCHGWIEANPDAAVAAGLRLKTMQEPADVPVWLSVPWPGWWLLDDDACYTPMDTDRDRPAALPPQVPLPV